MIDFLFKKSTLLYFGLVSKIKKRTADGKSSKFLLLVSDIVYYFSIFLSKLIYKREIKKLDKKKIFKYYQIYGREDALSKYKLTDDILDSIIKLYS